MGHPHGVPAESSKTLANGVTLPGSTPDESPDVYSGRHGDTSDLVAEFVSVLPESVPELEDTGAFERYEARGTISSGGMGEVRLCKDQRIGREVALKAMRS